MSHIIHKIVLFSERPMLCNFIIKFILICQKE